MFRRFQTKALAAWAIELAAADLSAPLAQLRAREAGCAAGLDLESAHQDGTVWWTHMDVMTAVYGFRAGFTSVLPTSERDREVLRDANQWLYDLPQCDQALAIWDAAFTPDVMDAFRGSRLSFQEQLNGFAPLAPDHVDGQPLLAWPVEPSELEREALEQVCATWHRPRPSGAWRIVLPAGSRVEREATHVTILVPDGSEVRLARGQATLPVVGAEEWLDAWPDRRWTGLRASELRDRSARDARARSLLSTLGDTAWAQEFGVQWRELPAGQRPAWMPRLDDSVSVTVAWHRERCLELVVLKNSVTGAVACGQWYDGAPTYSGVGRVWLPDESELANLEPPKRF